MTTPGQDQEGRPIMDTQDDSHEAARAAIHPAPDLLADEAAVLLHGPLAEAWEQRDPGAALRDRLAQRAARSAARNRAMVNVRRRDRVLLEQAPQRVVHEVYRRAADAGALRPGEPLRVRVVELSRQGAWLLSSGENGVGRDWLVLRGEVQLQTEAAPTLALGPLDYHVQSRAASRSPACVFAGPEGARVLLRERALGPADAACSGESSTSRNAPEEWQEYAPLIKRRVLWQEGPLAAMLWLAEPGASVPQHRHGHDEECLMLRGELFQDDYLLREGDYQLAPSGSAHETVSTDTGALIYAHGDLQMEFVSA
jgi:quercetin dioxygenase-like cupin family protein